MPSRVYTLPKTGRAKVDYYMNWNRSTRVNGKLVLRPQPFFFQRGIETEYTYISTGPWSLPSSLDVSTTSADGPLRASSGYWNQLETQALARFNGKLKKGGASLGVTLASWRQSRDMIVDRYQKLHSAFDKVESNLKKRKRRKPIRDFSRARASDVLEYEFGWVPLVQDIHAALKTACDVPESPWVRARQPAPISQTDIVSDNESTFVQKITYQGNAHVTISAQVVVSNPNLWLLNRLGLINPATIIWDLVPWSFLVNMIVNVNAIVSSFTDHVGLSFSNVSITRNRSVTRSFLCIAGKKQQNYKGVNTCVQQLRNVERRVGSFPTPTLEFHPPKLNWETAVILSSLLVQKINRIEKLAQVAFKGLPKNPRYTE